MPFSASSCVRLPGCLVRLTYYCVPKFMSHFLKFQLGLQDACVKKDAASGSKGAAPKQQVPGAKKPAAPRPSGSQKKEMGPV